MRLNAAMCCMLGLPSEADGLGLRLTDIVLNPETEESVAQARRAAQTGEPVHHRLFGPDRAPGERDRLLWNTVFSPVKDPAGEVLGVLVLGLDSTEHHVARERLALVNEASTRIGSTLDVTRTAQEMIEVVVPRLADFATIDLLETVLRGEEPGSGPVTRSAALRRIAVDSVLPGMPEAVIRPGEVASYPAQSPFALCLATGEAILYRSWGSNDNPWAGNDPIRDTYVHKFGVHSSIALPVRARGITLGVVLFLRHQRPEPFEEDDFVLAKEIVARAAVCVDNARRYTRERAAALTLQHSLLPQRLPEQIAIDVASRYLPAGSHVAVGGDWFDVIRLSGSRVGLVVGDVVGHGIHAAATMGRLRTAVRTLADLDLPPEELLTRLDDVVTRLVAEENVPLGETESDLSATCLYAVYDPVSRICSLARAGHPVPAVVTPEGETYFLDLQAGPPLGLGGLPFEGEECELPDGSLLVLYTDGLVESRERGIETGLNEMRRVLTEIHLRADGSLRPPPPLDSICDSVLTALLHERPTDDVALLIARTHALDSDRVASWELPAEPAVVASARARASRQLAAWKLEENAFTTELIVSELVTNALRHARTPIQVRMILDSTLICEVSDGSSAAPHLRQAHSFDEGGRGLLLVAHLTERWGTRQTRSGKIIWTEQALPRKSAAGLAGSG